MNNLKSHNNDTNYLLKGKKTVKKRYQKYEKNETMSVLYDINRTQQVYVVESEDPKIVTKLRGLGKLYHLFHRNQAFGFYQTKIFSQMQHFQQSSQVIQQKYLYSNDVKQGLQDVESIWKRKTQRLMVQAFSKISYQQKQLMEKTMILQDFIVTKRINRFFSKFKICPDYSKKYLQSQPVQQQQKTLIKINEIRSYEQIENQITTIQVALQNTVLKLQDSKIKDKQNSLFDLSQTLPFNKINKRYRKSSQWQAQKQRRSQLYNYRQPAKSVMKIPSKITNSRSSTVFKQKSNIKSYTNPCVSKNIIANYQPIVCDVIFIPVIEHRIIIDHVHPVIHNFYNRRINYF